MDRKPRLRHVGYRAYARTWDFCTPGKPVVSSPTIRRWAGTFETQSRGHAHRRALVLPHALVHSPLRDAGIVVVSYRDNAGGEMVMHRDGSGEFTSVTLTS